LLFRFFSKSEILFTVYTPLPCLCLCLCTFPPINLINLIMRKPIPTITPRRGDVFNNGILIGFRCDLDQCCTLPVPLRPIYNKIQWRYHHSKRGPHNGTGVVDYRGGARSGAERSALAREFTRENYRLLKATEQDAEYASAVSRYSGLHHQVISNLFLQGRVPTCVMNDKVPAYLKRAKPVESRYGKPFSMEPIRSIFNTRVAGPLRS
jgi:hypothetical protein